MKQEQIDTCEIDGVTYEAVDATPPSGRVPSCAGCAGMEFRICKRLPPCSPYCGRTDNKHKTWQRRREVDNG